MDSGLSVIKIGHRGVGEGCGENTIYSVKEAIELGMDMVELDVRLTGDRVPVVTHDNKVVVGKKTIKISSLTWDDIRKIDLPDCRKISTLRDMFDFISGRVGVLLDIKDAGCEKEVCRVLSDYIDSTPIIVTSFNLELLMAIKSILPQIKMGLMSIGLEREILSEVTPIFDVFLIYLPFLGKDIVEQIHKFGRQVFVWVVNTVEELRYAVMVGVDGVVVNNGRMLLEGM